MKRKESENKTMPEVETETKLSYIVYFGEDEYRFAKLKTAKRFAERFVRQSIELVSEFNCDESENIEFIATVSEVNNAETCAGNTVITEFGASICDGKISVYHSRK